MAFCQLSVRNLMSWPSSSAMSAASTSELESESASWDFFHREDFSMSPSSTTGSGLTCGVSQLIPWAWL